MFNLGLFCDFRTGIFLCLFYYLTNESSVASLPLCNASVFFSSCRTILSIFLYPYMTCKHGWAVLPFSSMIALMLALLSSHSNNLHYRGSKSWRWDHSLLQRFNLCLCRRVKFKLALLYTAEKCVYVGRQINLQIILSLQSFWFSLLSY